MYRALHQFIPSKVVLVIPVPKLLDLSRAQLQGVYIILTPVQSSSWFLPIMMFYVPLFGLALVVSDWEKEANPSSIYRSHLSSFIKTRYIYKSLRVYHRYLIVSMIGFVFKFANYLHKHCFCLTILLAVAIFFELMCFS